MNAEQVCSTLKLYTENTAKDRELAVSRATPGRAGWPTEQSVAAASTSRSPAYKTARVDAVARHPVKNTDMSAGIRVHWHDCYTDKQAKAYFLMACM
eukprot:6189851-Pleurochrysis_carterae.AAC.1